MPVEVSFRPKDFKNALKHLFALKPTRSQAKLEYVDFNTGDGEVELAWIPTEPFGPNIRVSAVA